VITVHDELISLRKDFAGFRIWRETIGERVLYVARSRRAGLNPHTVVTSNLAELRAALESSPNATRPHAGSATSTAKNAATPLSKTAGRVHRE
jgi:hypothetical protein